jgi:ATP-binding cassette subfamily G (WHITE) protein 2 (PDR)
MASDERHDYFPERTENILHDDIDRKDYPENSSTSDGSTVYQDQLHRTQTSETIRRERFEPIRAGDREQLQRIASQFGGGSQISRTITNADLERRDTLAGVKLGDPVLDPSSSEFDVYKWCRM